MRCTPCAVDFFEREDGPTAVEYAVMLAAMVISCVMAIAIIGSNTNSGINAANSAFVGSNASTGGSQTSDGSGSQNSGTSFGSTGNGNNGKGKAYGNDGDTTSKGN